MKRRIVDNGKKIEFYDFKSLTEYLKLRCNLILWSIGYEIDRLRKRIESKELKFTFKRDFYIIHLRGYEPIIYRKRVISSNHTEHYTFSLFYPIGVIKRVIGDCSIYLKLLVKGYIPQKCGICGESIAEYTIANPNTDFKGVPAKKRLEACRYCINSMFAWREDVRKLRQKKR